MSFNVITPKVADIHEQKLPRELSGSVGIILVDAEQGPFHGRVAVLTLVEGGAAEKDGRIHPGDLIVSVDEHNVVDWGLESIRLLVHGRVDTIVLLEFERPSTGTCFCVPLRRESQRAVEEHDLQLQQQLDQAQKELIKEAVAHDAAEIRANLEEIELTTLRNQISSTRREISELVAAHDAAMARSRAEQSDAMTELRLKDEELRVLTTELSDERVLLLEVQQELQEIQEKKLEQSRQPAASLRGVQI